MFDIGFWELATIAIIGIVVVGPDRLPEVVRTIALYIRKIRRAFDSVKGDIERELDLDDLRREMHDLDMQEHIRKLNQSVMDMEHDVRDAASGIGDDWAAADAAMRERHETPPPVGDDYRDTGVEDEPSPAEQNSEDSDTNEARLPDSAPPSADSVISVGTAAGVRTETTTAPSARSENADAVIAQQQTRKPQENPDD